VASIALAMSTSFPLSLLLMVPIGAGGITMAATANATIQLAVPDGLRGRVMSVYTTVFSASMPIGGLLMGVLASRLGILEAIAIGGALSLAAGVVAFAWYRRIAPRPTPIPQGATPGLVEVLAESGQSTAPSTSAAFSPPNPNEVLSTRR
jgi:MFS family permease